MVNVGGRSKGCSTCRRRRVKCDENRPACKRCQRWGLDCEGPKDTAFVQGTIVTSRRSQKPETAWATHDSHEQGFAVQPIPQSAVLLKHDKHEVYICYTRKYLHPNGPIDLGLQDLQLTDITRADRSVFPQAVMSFATVYFGAQHRQANVLAQGYAMHGAALRQLNHALSDSYCYIRDDVIRSVIALAILECLVPTGPRNYLKHMLGLERLLELRTLDPLAQCSIKSSELYKGVKFMVLLASLRTKRPSILAQPGWKAVLRLHCSDQELQEQDLCDVLAECTVLLAKCDNLLSCWETDSEKLGDQRNTLRKALALLTYLRAWKKCWDGDEHNAFTETAAYADDWLSSPTSSVNEHSQFLPTAIRFKTPSALRMFMLYNTTLIHVLQTLISLALQNLKGHNNTQDSFPNDWQYTASKDTNIWECISKAEWAAAERLVALQIARCIPDFLNQKRAHSDTQYASPVFQWAITTARMTLGGDETAAGRWMMSLLSGKSNSQAIAEGLWET